MIFILNKVSSQRATKISFIFNGGKMIKWKVGAVEKCPWWRLYWWKSFPSLRSIISHTLFRFYKSENLYYKLQVQVTSDEKWAPAYKYLVILSKVKAKSTLGLILARPTLSPLREYFVRKFRREG